MEKNRSTKIIAIAALFIAVIGLSIGFAAFSSTLTINSSANVTPTDSTWRVGLVFNTSNSLQSPGSYSTSDNVTGGFEYAEPTLNNITINNYQEDDFTVDAAEGSKVTSATIGNLKAYFTAPNQSVTYRFYVKNEGNLDAYLKDIIFTPFDGDKCVAVDQGAGVATADSGLMNAVCNDISVNVSVGTATNVTTTTNNMTSGSVVNKALGTAPTTPVTVTISYADNAHYVDAPIDVRLGSITLKYDAVPYSG